MRTSVGRVFIVMTREGISNGGVGDAVFVWGGGGGWRFGGLGKSKVNQQC